MAKFTVRIMLEGYPESDDYQTLHDAMEALGFTRTITNLKSGKTYKLPHGEYNYEGNITRNAVLNLAEKAAKKTNEDFQIFVTESAGRTWSNLKEEKTKKMIFGNKKGI